VGLAPLISILIPVYNRERYIEECVRSAIGQTWPHLEVVVVDNQSADGTWAICQSLARQDIRIRLFRNDVNLGPVHNWRRCLDAARGHLGVLLFSDDTLRPRFLEETAPFLADPDIAFAFAAVNHGSRRERSRILYTWGGCDGTVSSQQYLRDAMYHNGALPCSPGATVFRLADLWKNLAAEIPSPSMRGFAEHGAGPDLLLSLRTAAAYPAVAHVARPLAFFRDHAEAISRGNRELLDSAYAQARIWFATAQCDALFNRAFGGYWVQQMKKARRWLNPGEIETRFLGPGMKRPNYAAALWHGVARG
jgi:glycosyltransferase involved in cell wall biosynthesis